MTVMGSLEVGWMEQIQMSGKRNWHNTIDWVWGDKDPSSGKNWAGRRRGLVLTEVGAIHCDRQYRRSTTRSDYETLSELCFYMVEEREEGGNRE